MRRRYGRLGVIVSAAILIAAVVSPVAAYVSETGYHYCAANWTPYARSYSTGVTDLYPPGSGFKTFNNGSTWTVRQWHADVPGGGGWWGVYAMTGSLNGPGTYPGCTNIY